MPIILILIQQNGGTDKVAQLRWRLAELMARHRIQGKDLAQRWGKKPSWISKVKRDMPRLDLQDLERLLESLNILAAQSGTLNQPITLDDLIEEDIAKKHNPPLQIWCLPLTQTSLLKAPLSR